MKKKMLPLAGTLTMLAMMTAPLSGWAAEKQITTRRTITYTHLYSDAQGVSRFKQATLEFEPLPGERSDDVLMIHALKNAKEAAFLNLKRGAVEDWHAAPRRQFLVVVQGAADVTAGSGEVRRFKAGDVVLMDDTTGKGHITTAAGDIDHVALLVPCD